MPRHHVGVRLPDGRHAVATWQEPVVKIMARIHRARMDGGEPRPADYAAVAAWLDQGNGCDFLCESTHEESGNPAG